MGIQLSSLGRPLLSLQKNPLGLRTPGRDLKFPFHIMSSGSSLPCSSECLGSSVETCRETSPWCWWRTKLGRNKAGWSGMLPPMKAWACGSGQCYLSSMWPTGGSLLISITLFPSISRNAEGGPVFPPPTPSTQDTHPECTYTCTYTNVHIHMRAHTLSSCLQRVPCFFKGRWC